MKFISTSLLILTASLSSYGQLEVPSESFNMTLSKAKKVSKVMNQNSATSVGRDNNKVMVRIKLDSYSEDKKQLIDLNKLSVVDHNQKLRFRPLDIAIGHPLGYKAGVRLKKNPKAKSGMFIRNKPEIEDTFNDYDIKGYRNIEYVLQLTLRKRDTSVLYLQPTDRSIKRLQLFFGLPKIHRKNVYELYYGNEKVDQFKY